MANQISALDTTFHALADPTRRAVIARLMEGPASVSELARPFSMAMPTVLQHLKVLEAGRLITTRKEGRVRVCALKTETLREAEDWLSGQRAIWESRFDQFDAFVISLKNKE